MIECKSIALWLHALIDLTSIRSLFIQQLQAKERTIPEAEIELNKRFKKLDSSITNDNKLGGIKVVKFLVNTDTNLDDEETNYGCERDLPSFMRQPKIRFYGYRSQRNEDKSIFVVLSDLPDSSINQFMIDTHRDLIVLILFCLFSVKYSPFLDHADPRSIPFEKERTLLIQWFERSIRHW